LVTALRGARLRLARGECAIPKDLIPKEFPYHKFNHEDPKSELTENENKMLKEAVKDMVHVASSHLSKARDLQGNVPKHARPCFLPVVPALHYLSKLEKADYDIFDDSLLEQDHLTVLALLGRTWLTGVF
jgi:NADH dehydrogenase [ubiquinone] 1 alpha subcomplex assembly factor 6